MKVLTVFSRSQEQCTCKTNKGKTLSCGTNSCLLFAVNVTLNLSYIKLCLKQRLLKTHLSVKFLNLFIFPSGGLLSHS